MLQNNMNFGNQRSMTEGGEIDGVPYIVFSIEEPMNIPPLPNNHRLEMIISCGKMRQVFSEVYCQRLRVPVESLDHTLQIRIQSRQNNLLMDIWNRAREGVAKVFSTNQYSGGISLQMEIPLSVVDPLAGPKVLQSYFALAEIPPEEQTIFAPKKSRAHQLRLYNASLATAKNQPYAPKVHIVVEADANSSKNTSTKLWRSAVCPKSGREYWYNVETRKTQWTNPEEEERSRQRPPRARKGAYQPIQHDRIDVEIAKYLQKHPNVHEAISIKRLKLGEYMIDSRTVKLQMRPWGKESKPILVVADGPMKQPFEDYITGSPENEVWEGVETSLAVHALPQHARLTFKAMPPPQQRPPDRLLAMRTAKKEAILREENALQKLSKWPENQNFAKSNSAKFGRGTSGDITSTKSTVGRNSWESTRPSTPSEVYATTPQSSGSGLKSSAPLEAEKEMNYGGLQAAVVETPAAFRIPDASTVPAYQTRSMTQAGSISVTPTMGQTYAAYQPVHSFTHQPQQTKGYFPSIFTNPALAGGNSFQTGPNAYTSWDPSTSSWLNGYNYNNSFVTNQSWQGSYVPDVQLSTRDSYTPPQAYATQGSFTPSQYRYQ
eukprot:Platyproteum_vivax@DN5453_c0_g1_i1.p1